MREKLEQIASRIQRDPGKIFPSPASAIASTSCGSSSGARKRRIRRTILGGTRMAWQKTPLERDINNVFPHIVQKKEFCPYVPSWKIYTCNSSSGPSQCFPCKACMRRAKNLFLGSGGAGDETFRAKFFSEELEEEALWKNVRRFKDRWPGRSSISRCRILSWIRGLPPAM